MSLASFKAGFLLRFGNIGTLKQRIAFSLIQNNERNALFEEDRTSVSTYPILNSMTPDISPLSKSTVELKRVTWFCQEIWLSLSQQLFGAS